MHGNLEKVCVFENCGWVILSKPHERHINPKAPTNEHAENS